MFQAGSPQKEIRKRWRHLLTPSGTGVDVVPSYALNLLNYSDVRTSGNYTNLGHGNNR